MMRRIYTLMCMTATTLLLMAQQPHPERYYLSGTGIDNTRTWKFYCTKGQHSGKWGKIQVPCNWELQGYGDYTYGRYYKTKGGVASNEEGTYHYSFKVPTAWKGQKVKIVFDGVMTDTKVTINGKSAGEMHQGGFYRFSYDITDLVDYKKANELEVHVAKESANKSVNAAERKADWWLFSGIYRPVWLEATPQNAMDYVVVSGKADGKMTVGVDFAGDFKGYSLSASVKSLADGKVLSSDVNSTVFTSVKPNERLIWETSWNKPKTWDPEHPNLYVVKLELKDANNEIVQTKEIRTAFRTLEFFEKDGLYLNGTRLIVKGVNRHTFWPEGGRTTSHALSLQDAKLVKEMNMNAIRSHYPPDEHFLDVCDSIGILYMDELAGWQNSYDSNVGPKLVEEMIKRDVNHPCIMIWSNGNEGGWNNNLDKLFAKYDYLQQRHVVHPWADFNELDTHHYPAYLTGVGRFVNGYKVFMPTEFMHAMYDQGGGAGLRDFWERWMTSPYFAGGFIWAFCDEAVARTDKKGIFDSDNSNAPDGLLGPHREKEGSFYAVRESWSPIQIKPMHVTSHFNGDFFVTNEYLFTNFSECTMKYKVLSCDAPLSGNSGNKEIAAGEVKLPAIAPGETGKAHFDVPSALQQGDVLALEAFNKNGESICNWSYPIHLVDKYFDKAISKGVVAGSVGSAQNNMADATKNGSEIVLKGGNMTVTFNAENGMIKKILSGEKEIPFNNGPVPVGMKMKYDAAKSYTNTVSIKDADKRERLKAGATYNCNAAVYCAKYLGAADSIVWTLTNDGLLYMDAVLLNRASGGGGFDDAFTDDEVYNLGLTFSYPEANCSGMKWFGKGPYRVWKNRLPGTNYGVWQKDYNNTITGESFENLIYPEFKGYHANLYWATLESKTTPFTVYAHNDGIYFRVFTPEEPKGRADGKPTMPEFPQGDISFLLDIPAICSFKPIKQQGPQSQPGNIRIKKGDEGVRINLMFDFRQK